MNDGNRALKQGPTGGTKPKAVLPLFFKRIEALDSGRHRALRRRPRASYRFALGTNAIPLAFSEIAKAAQEYPVVFAGEGEAMHLVALVGLTADNNLFVGAEGEWQGRYLPAYLRNYPFAFARVPRQAPGTYTVAIDPESSELSRHEGSLLFTDSGAHTPFLTQSIEFLRHYDAQCEQSRKFANRVAALGLLQAVNANVRLISGKQYALSGLRVVDRNVLKALPVAARMELYDAEWLEPIYHHLASLQTFSQLVDRLALRSAAVAPA